MLLVKSREYKLMLDQRSFREWEEGAKRFWDEVKEFVVPLGLNFTGSLGGVKERTVEFLDTEDHTIRANGYVLRRRVKKNGKAEYTLKYRTEDRYEAAGADISTQLPGNEAKFEEDIAPPFRSRYSHSNKFDDSGAVPDSLGKAARLFPALGQLRRDGMVCPPSTPLTAVNGIRAFERVLEEKGLDLLGQKIDVALILWSNGPTGRPLVAEFSFRYPAKKDDDGDSDDNEESFTAPLSRNARRLFSTLQRMDWAHPQAMTKTEYVYRSTSETAAGD